VAHPRLPLNARWYTAGMLTVATRAYTDLELDVYSERLLGNRFVSLSALAIIALAFGGLLTLAAFAVFWIYALITSGTTSWTYPLIIGGAAAALCFTTLWFYGPGDEWTEQPPELATDLSATAYAAWLYEDDGLDTILVLRVEADRYLLVTQSSISIQLLQEPDPPSTSTSTTTAVPCEIRLTLLGEGPHRIAIDGALSGHEIPLTRVTVLPEDRDDETTIPDGLYITAELPERIRRAIGLP